MNWTCANFSCPEWGIQKALGPGNLLVTWTCKECGKPLVRCIVTVAT